MIDTNVETSLIATVGRNPGDETALFFTAKELNVKTVFVVTDGESDADVFDSQRIKILNHFGDFDIPVYFENLNITDFEMEYLFLAKSFVEKLESFKLIVMDCSLGPRYLQPIIQDAVSIISLLSKSLIGHEIKKFEAIRRGGTRKPYFYSHHLWTINHQVYNILPYIEPGMGEVEIAEFVNLRQSTVSSHIKKLRSLNLIEGKSKKNRKKSTKGMLVEDIGDILKNKIQKV